VGDYLVYSSNTRQTPLWPSHEEISSIRSWVYASEAPTDRVASAHREKHISPNTYAFLDLCTQAPFVMLIKGNLFYCKPTRIGFRFSFDSYRLLRGGFAEVEIITDSHHLHLRKSVCQWVPLQFFWIRCSKLIRTSEWESYIETSSKLLSDCTLTGVCCRLITDAIQPCSSSETNAGRRVHVYTTWDAHHDFVFILLLVQLHPWNRNQVLSLAFIHDQPVTR